MSSVILELEKGLCRCCHSQGSFKNLAEPVKTTGLSVLYADILNECFDIDMCPVAGILNAATYTICDVCAIRLQDASDFKKQVLLCEARFHDLLNKNRIKVAVPIVGVEVKQEIIISDSEDDELIVQAIPAVNNDDNDFNDFDASEDLNFSDNEEDQPVEEVVSEKETKCKTKKTVTKKTKQQAAKKKETEEKKNAEKKQDYATSIASYYTLEDQEDGSKNYVCTSCLKKYKSRKCVVQHYRSVHLRLNSESRSCHLCDIKVQRYSLAYHLEKEHGIPGPTCNACGKKFAYAFHVLRHQRQYHMGEKEFGCGKCELRFSTQNQLTLHMIKHSGVRVHKCDICEKSFKWKRNLTLHLMIHNDERRHVCHVCKEAFVQRASLKYHITKRHPECV